MFALVEKLYSQTCVAWDPKKCPLFDRWSLFKGHLGNESTKWDLKKVVVIDRWSLFGGGR
jgi:hypothetical protein